MNTFTVCVISSHPIVAAGIRTLLLEHPDCAQCLCVPEPDDATVVIYDAFNLAIADHHIRELDRVIATRPGRVLVLSRLLQPGLTARALAAGAGVPRSRSVQIRTSSPPSSKRLPPERSLPTPSSRTGTSRRHTPPSFAPTSASHPANGPSSRSLPPDTATTRSRQSSTSASTPSRRPSATPTPHSVARAGPRPWPGPSSTATPPHRPGIEQERAPHADKPRSSRAVTRAVALLKLLVMARNGSGRRDPAGRDHRGPSSPPLWTNG